VSLKKLESGLIRGQIVPFIRENRPFKKSTKKYNAASGIIAGELLREDPLSPGILDMFFFEISYHVSLLVSEFIYLKIAQIFN
jgi:hypothetical protein